ncbi:hypothetical protein [Sphingomonas sp. IW22]|uniref:head-tail joining protein n=1 Tax=Sphingomonas sp. IW22 TaxID=3242489 RepID=UPI0035216840
MSIWDEMTAICFERLGDEALYTIAATGKARTVTVIPVDSANSWQAKRGDAQVTGTKIEAQFYASDFPAGWQGPAIDANGKPTDILAMSGRRYRVRPVREELNGVWVTELEITRR